MENMSIKDVILEKKTDSYGVNMNDFKAPQELTVEVTLNEYRELVSKVATRQDAIDKIGKEKYELQKEKELLKEQVEGLKAENYELQKKVDELKKMQIPMQSEVALYSAECEKA